MECWKESPRCLWRSWEYTIHSEGLLRGTIFCHNTRGNNMQGFPSPKQKGGGRQTEQRTGWSLWIKVSVESQKPPRLLASIWGTGMHGREGQDASFILPVKVFSVLTLFWQSHLNKRTGGLVRKTRCPFSGQWTWKSAKTLEKAFLPLPGLTSRQTLLTPSVPVPSYHRLLSLKCKQKKTEKQSVQEAATWSHLNL